MTNSNGQHPVTLDDLGEFHTTVSLTRPDGKVIVVPVRSLSEQEVWEMRQAMKWPEPPFDLGKFDGPDRPPRKQFKFDDAGYRSQTDAANRQFSRRLMARSLLIAIPGESEDDKASALESKLGAWAATQLQTHLNRLLGIGEAEVASIADSFLAAADSDT